MTPTMAELAMSTRMRVVHGAQSDVMSEAEDKLRKVQGLLTNKNLTHAAVAQSLGVSLPTAMRLLKQLVARNMAVTWTVKRTVWYGASPALRAILRRRK